MRDVEHGWPAVAAMREEKASGGARMFPASGRSKRRLQAESRQRPVRSVVAEQRRERGVGVDDDVAVGVAGEQPDPEYVGFFAFCLACTAVLCGWHARNQEGRRAALASGSSSSGSPPIGTSMSTLMLCGGLVPAGIRSMFMMACRLGVLSVCENAKICQWREP